MNISHIISCIIFVFHCHQAMSFSAHIENLLWEKTENYSHSLDWNSFVEVASALFEEHPWIGEEDKAQWVDEFSKRSILVKDFGANFLIITREMLSDIFFSKTVIIGVPPAGYPPICQEYYSFDSAAPVPEGPAMEEINPSAQVAPFLDIPKAQSAIKKPANCRKKNRKRQPWDQRTFRLNNFVWHPSQMPPNQP
jgi:hypothetical protein